MKQFIKSTAFMFYGTWAGPVKMMRFVVIAGYMKWPASSPSATTATSAANAVAFVTTMNVRLEFYPGLIAHFFCERKRKMAHHYSEHPEDRAMLDEFRKNQAKRLGLGATGAFPQGVVNDLDEGEIQFGISSDNKREKVFLNFGKPVSFIGMTPEQAIQVAQSLIKHARESTSEPLMIVLH